MHIKFQVAPKLVCGGFSVTWGPKVMHPSCHEVSIAFLQQVILPSCFPGGTQEVMSPTPFRSLASRTLEKRHGYHHGLK